MKDCETCGNEIPDREMVCRFCKAPQPATTTAPPSGGLRTINIKAGMPLVEAGLARLEQELAQAMRAGVRVVRIIHGYGSTGKGGLLRDACRACLGRMLKSGQITSFLPGEDYSGATNAARNLIRRCPELRSSERTDRLNPGITFVEP
jgi:Smr domain